MSNPTLENARVIYEQRTETFRHLDRLRWQMPSLAIVASGVLLTAGKSDRTDYPAAWAFFVTSIVCALAAYSIYRIRLSIRDNTSALRCVAETIGDGAIPEDAGPLGATFFAICTLTWLAAVSLAASIWLFVDPVAGRQEVECAPKVAPSAPRHAVGEPLHRGEVQPSASTMRR